MSQSFGASLREARERKGLSLRQIATATKIPVNTLDSLERDDFSRLPGGIFSRAFVRSYAIEVGLDPDETVQRFLLQFEGEEAGGLPPHEADGAPAPTRPPATAGRFATVNLMPESDFESRQRMAAVVLKLVVASIPIAAALLYFGSGERTPPPERGAPAPASHVTGPEDISAEREPRAEPAIVAERRTAPRTSSANAPAAETPAPLAQRAEGDITIEIAPTADCWAMLTADGTVVVSGVLAAGQRARRSFRDTAILKVGDAAACAILINGRPARPLGPPGKVREIRLTRDNYASFLP